MRWARSKVRLVTIMAPAPCWTRWRAASSLIFRAPTRKTVRPVSEPKILRAKSTATEAMETELEPISVSVRTFLAAAKALQQVFELPADGARGTRDGEGLLDLAQNLRLADDHGVEAGGYAEEVADGCLIAVLINMRFEQRGIEGEMVLQKTGQVDGGRFEGGENLHPVAGGDDHALGDAG